MRLTALRHLAILCFLIAPLRADDAAAVSRGREFLVGLFNPELNLLPEYAGAKVYWLYHDNYLAAKVLAPTHPDLAKQIMEAIRAHGVVRSGKIEILFGEAGNPRPFRHYELREVTKIGPVVIRTEVVTDEPNPNWSEYADLLLLAALAEPVAADARSHFEAALTMWDGTGFRDKVETQDHRYATYKLALALLGARHLGQTPPALPAIRARLLAAQVDTGGWLTDYRADGAVISLTNVETTSLAILALDPTIPAPGTPLNPER
jgi:hypothetical protein